MLAGGSGLSGSSSVLTGPPTGWLGQPVKLCAMTRRVPAARAASSRWSVPWIRSWLVTANVRSKCLRSLSPASPVIWCMITSGRAAVTAWMVASRFSPSATTGSAPSWRSSPVLPGDRVVAVTWWPAAVSIGIRLCPTTPVPPAMNTRMVTPLSSSVVTRLTRREPAL